MIPNRLEDWTFDRIQQLVNNDGNESEIHDFKSDLPPTPELTKDCCAFANSKGGFIILGIVEFGRRFRIEGIEPDKDLANRFGQKLNALPMNPRFVIAPFIAIPDSQKVLAVISIPRTNEGPYIPLPKDQRTFWKRTNSGNEQMSYEEIKAAFTKHLNHSDFTKNEIRFRILFVLYINHFGGKFQTQTANVIKQADLGYHDSNFLNGEIIYLKDSELIKGIQPIGHKAPYTLMITQRGIDKVSEWISDFKEVLRKELNPEYRQVMIMNGMNMLSELWRIFNQYDNARRSFFQR